MVKKQELWISANEAAKIISKNSGRPIHPDYVRLLARQNPKKLASKPLDGRTNVYLRSDAEKIKVRAKRVNTQQELQTPEVSVPTTRETLPSEKEPVAEERPWYLPEQGEEKQAEEKSEPDAA